MELKDKIEMAYLAGVMDGDGSFSLGKRNGGEGRSSLYYPLIQLGSLSQLLVEFSKNRLGGSTRLNKAKVGKDGINRRDFYVWKAEKSSQCIEVLNKISSFLVLKKERAEFLLEYILRNPFKRGSNKLSEEILTQREIDYRKMKEFNSPKFSAKSFTKKIASTPTEDELFWSYLAGLIDTDGSLSIRRNMATVDSKSLRYTPMIQLSMNDIAGLNFIKENCPYGRFSFIKAKTCINGIMNRWCVQPRDEVIEVLNRIIPYLKVKKDNALILLNFCKNFITTAQRSACIPQDQLDFREKCYQELVYFNKYGVYKPSLIDLEAQDMGDRAELFRETVND